MHVKCWKSKEGYMSTRTTYSRRHASMVNTNIQPMITEQQGLTITRLCCCRSTANTGMIRETLLLTAKLLGNFILRKIKIAYLLNGMINSYQSHMHVDIFENLTHMLLVLHWALSNYLCICDPCEICFMLSKLRSQTLHIYLCRLLHWKLHKNMPFIHTKILLSFWHDSSYCKKKYGLCGRKRKSIRAQKHRKRKKKKEKER